MSMSRRESESLWPQLFEPGGALSWPFRPFEAWRRLVDEEQLSVEEFMENDQVVVRAELPGVDPDRDIDISIVDGNLRIRAERRQEEKVEERNYRRSEIRYGSFTRTIPLPAGTKEDDITANYTDGILEVRAPVDQSAGKPSKIPINRG